MHKILCSLLGICSFIAATSQQKISYEVIPSNLAHHEITIKATFEGFDTDTLLISMPNTSPGRYAEHNFAKNVYNEKAIDDNQQLLAIKKASIASWKIPTKSNKVTFSYTLFANHADGTYSGVDIKKMHLNMPATFVYAPAMMNAPITIWFDIHSKPDWSIATQLKPESKNVYSAPNQQYFFDSPTIIGDLQYNSWEVDGQTIEVAMLHEGNAQEFDQYCDWIKKIVDQEKKIFGSLPKFDYSKYTFLCTYNPWVFGDGMEHRNSTICSSQGNLSQHAPYLIGTIAHEFFHAWNIERIRPATLEPFDFDEANMSGELWFGEGFTNYFDEVTQCRAGIITKEDYLKTATRVLNRVANSPARTVRNPIQMSQNAPFVDAAKSIDETNYTNNFISYYTYGEHLGLILDLSIRASFPDKSLDLLMQYMWKNYGQPEIPYTLKDIEKGLASFTTEKFAANYFKKFIYNSEIPDYQSLFKKIGISMSLTNENGINWAGTKVDETGIVTSQTVVGSVLYNAGIDQNDQILSINGIELNSEMSYDKIIETLNPNNTYSITYQKMGELIATKITTDADPSITLNWIETPSKSQEKEIKNWLGAK